MSTLFALLLCLGAGASEIVTERVLRVRGGLAETARFPVAETPVVRVDIRNAVNAIGDVASARPEVGINGLVFHGPALEFWLELFACAPRECDS